ncbi:MAG TPA: ABC transporter permease [Candidatus Limnocylindria bacterium]|nr:ABC transporter permease [Candidatus Limnocylindria bacterium]
MKLALFGFVMRRVGHSLWQLRWTHLLTCGTLAMTLFVFGAFVLVQLNLEQWLTGWGDQLQITAYLKRDLDPGAVAKLVERVTAFPEVERVHYTDHEQAWRDFEIALGSQSGLLDGLPRDLLPASFEITLKAERRDGPGVEQLAARLKQEPGVTIVEYPQEWVERLALIVLAVRWAKWIVGGVLFLATFFIVVSTAKLAVLARRDEVEIMQLVGASEELIQAPFVIEGMILGLVGAAVSMAVLWAAFLLLQNELPVLGFWSSLTEPLRFLDTTGVGLIAGIGWVLGAAGSLFSLRRFVRRWKPVGRTK